MCTALMSSKASAVAPAKMKQANRKIAALKRICRPGMIVSALKKPTEGWNNRK